MIVLDENICAEQKASLQTRGIRTRKVGVELAARGTDDDDLIPILHSLPEPTFFTHDRDFWRQSLVHPAYCIVWLDMEDGEAASYIRRFLRHPDFRTHAARLGKVVRVHADSLTFFDSRHGKAKQVPWLRAV